MGDGGGVAAATGATGIMSAAARVRDATPVAPTQSSPMPGGGEPAGSTLRSMSLAIAAHV